MKSVLPNIRFFVKGFTLIELLVVVTIISVLSTLIVAAVNPGKRMMQARVTSGLRFGQYVDRMLAMEAVGQWDFTEPGNPSQAIDSSGNNNHGSITGATYNCSDSPYHVTDQSSGKCALSFNGTSFIDLGNTATLQITGNQTIEMWLKPNNFSVRRNPYAKAYGGEGTITQEMNGQVNYYYGTCGGNCAPYQGFTMTSAMKQNEWTHLVLVRDLKNMRLAWYKDGKKTNEVTANYPAAASSLSNAYIGRGYVSMYDGLIAEVRIYASALTARNINQLYADSALKYFSFD